MAPCRHTLRRPGQSWAGTFGWRDTPHLGTDLLHKDLQENRMEVGVFIEVLEFTNITGCQWLNHFVSSNIQQILPILE